MQYAYRLLLLDGYFRGVHHFWDNPYLNSTTVLFDNIYAHLTMQYNDICTMLLEEIKGFTMV